MAGLASWSQLPRLHALTAQTGAAASPGFRFTDVTGPAGIQFQHNSGAFGGKFLPETLGSGCAFLDYDRDGWQDILLINGTDWPGHKKRRSTLRLYHNNGNGTFTDVTTRAGLDVEMYGMGVAVGDYNNDGFPDILVTCVGQNRLFRNTGQRHVRRRNQRQRTGQARGIQHVRVVVRLRPRRLARSLRLQLREVVAGTRRVLQSRRKTQIVLHSRSLSRSHVLAVSQSRRRHVRRRHRGQRNFRQQFQVAGGRPVRRQSRSAGPTCSSPMTRSPTSFIATSTMAHSRMPRSRPDSLSAAKARPARAWASTSLISTIPERPESPSRTSTTK